MKIVVRAFLLSDEPDERVSPCGYACACCTGYSDKDIRKLKEQAREDLKARVQLNKYERVKYKVQIIY